MTLATAGFAIKTKVTRRAQFLAEMDKVVPWSRLLAVIEPHYPVAEQGRPRPPLERMLHIYFMQQWFNLSDPAMEDALYDSEAMRRFAGIDPGADVVPDESTILRFRHVLEEHKLTERMFQEVRQLPGRTETAAQVGNDRGCDDHCGAAIDQERHAEPGPGDEAGPQGQPMALRDEDPCEHGPARVGAQLGDRSGVAR